MNHIAGMIVCIGICVVLPILIVYLTQRYKLRSENNRKEIILAALEKDANINIEELVKKMNKPEKLIKEKMLNKLQTGCLLTFMGMGLSIVDVVFAYNGGFNTNEIFIFGMCGAAFLSLGIAYLITYFAGKKSLAKEMEAEQKNLEEN